jgi:phytoene synthase
LITKQRAKNFYWAFITLPKNKQESIHVIYTFFRRLDDIVDASLPVEKKRKLLTKQKELIKRCYNGFNFGFSDDPVLFALGDVIYRYKIPQGYFEDVIFGVEMDLVFDHYRTFEDLKRYCYGVAGAVGLISLEIFGYKDPKAKEHAADLGIAMQLTNILRDILEDLNRGRIYLPLEELRGFGYSEEELKQSIINDQFIELMRFQVERARDYFSQGRKLLKYLPLRCRPCPAVLAGIYQQILNRIEACGYDVFTQRISLSSQEKLFTLLRASAGSLRG